MAQFLLSCESTVEYMHSCGIPVIFYSYIVDEQAYPDDMGRDPEVLPRFYAFLDAGKLPSTSQINQFAYYDYFQGLLEQGGNVLHIAFGSGMTQSVNQAYEAAEQLRAEFPNQRLEMIDSLCSSSGYGLLVDGAADLCDAGKSMDETIDWVMAWRKRVHHPFYSTDLKYFRRSGRVSGPAATVGAILGICPIMRLDDCGRIIAYDKVRSKKAAVRARFPHIHGEIRICDIGRSSRPTPAPARWRCSSSATSARRSERGKNKKQETARDPKRIGAVSCLHAKQKG